MSRFKRLLGLMLAVCMVCSVSVTAWAEETNNNENSRVDKEIVKSLTKLDTKITGYTTTNIINETVNVTIMALSDNVTAVQFGYFNRQGFDIIWSDDMYEDDVFSFDVGAIQGYTVYVKITEGDISSTNPGVVTFHISDRL